MIATAFIALALQAAPATKQFTVSDVLPVCRAAASRSADGYEPQVLLDAVLRTFDGMGMNGEQKADALDVCIVYLNGYADALSSLLPKT